MTPAKSPSKICPTSWFHHRVVKPRLLAAFIWATLATPLCGGVALAFLGGGGGVFSSLAFFLSSLFSLSLYRLLFWTSLGVSLSSYLSLIRALPLSTTTTGSPTSRVHSSRVALLLALARPTLLGVVASQAALGGAIVKTIVSIAAPDFDAFVVPASSSTSEDVEAAAANTTLLHEGAVFVAAGGFFAAARAAFGDFIREDGNDLTPNGASLRLSKRFRVRKGLMAALVSSLKDAFSTMKWFFVLYFFLGNVVKDSLCPWLISRPVCPSSSSQVALNSLLGLMEIRVLWKTFVAVAYLLFARRLVKSIVVAYMFEPLGFPLSDSGSTPEDGQPTLEATLAPKTGEAMPPLAQLLAFQHLHELTKTSASARRPIFSLSQPGGHPHAWNAVSNACVGHLAAVLAALGECNAAAAAAGGNNNALAAAAKPAAASTTPTSMMMRLSPVRYLLQEFPGAKARKVFIDSTKSILTVDSLSHLVAASFIEDDFGVVQKKLAALLDLLVATYDAVEKNVKLYPCHSSATGSAAANGGTGTSSSAPAAGRSVVGAVSGGVSHGGVGGDDDADILATARPALRSALKASIYRIVVTFGSHLFGVQGLTAETKKRLKSFVEMKE